MGICGTFDWKYLLHKAATVPQYERVLFSGEKYWQHSKKYISNDTGLQELFYMIANQAGKGPPKKNFNCQQTAYLLDSKIRGKQ
jgi:hypothetical protein